jgi:Excreted virulence factor EspC, type VII ESX diderm
MFADTDAIRALGSANSAHADDLADIAATLSSLPVAMAESTLGPVAARFLSALADAADEGSRAVLALSDRLTGAQATAYAAAAAYDDADHGAGTRITAV